MESQDRIRQAIRVRGVGNRLQTRGVHVEEMLTRERLELKESGISISSKSKQERSFSGAGTSGWTLTFSEYQAQESRD